MTILLLKHFVLDFFISYFLVEIYFYIKAHITILHHIQYLIF